MSVSLGSVETTLLKLTSAYSAFVNGGKKVNPMLFNKIQDRRGNTIFKPENIKCSGCDKFSSDSNDTPTINYDFNKMYFFIWILEILSLADLVVSVVYIWA